MVEFTSGMSKPTVEIYIRTILLVATWIILGVSSEIVGPTMSILAHNTHVTYEGIASALASGAAGSLVANILLGICQKSINDYQDLMLATAVFLRGMSGAVTPFIDSLILLCTVFFTNGIMSSFVNMGGTNLLFKMWDTRVATPLNMVHFGYGLGAICANLIVRPFLHTGHSHVNTTEVLKINSTISATISGPLDADIRGPYFISAGLCLLVGVGHLIFFVRELKNKSTTTKKPQMDYTPVNTNGSKSETHPNDIKFSQYSPATCGHGYFGYGLWISSNFTLYMFFVCGFDVSLGKFYFSYLKFDKFNISTNAASWGIILFWLSFSIGRIIGAILSVFVSTHICLVMVWCGSVILGVAWMICVWVLGLTATSLFILGSLTGLIIAPLFPLSFAWIKQQLHVTPPLLGITLCGSGLGALVIQKIAGFVMDRDPNHFPTLLGSCMIVSIFFYIVLNVIVFTHKRNLKTSHHSISKDKSLESLAAEEIDEKEEEQLAGYLQGVNEIE